MNEWQVNKRKRSQLENDFSGFASHDNSLPPHSEPQQLNTIFTATHKLDPWS